MVLDLVNSYNDNDQTFTWWMTKHDETPQTQNELWIKFNNLSKSQLNKRTTRI